jgi:F0F1-type ATP synthase membrane subunit b/b'
LSLRSFFAVNLSELAQVLMALGCPPERSAEMAAQLDKRAKQLAEEKKRSYNEALTHLLTLMRQGWAAQEKGVVDKKPFA